MDHNSIDPVVAYSEHLSALAAAGVPVRLGPGWPTPEATLDEFRSKIAEPLSHGDSLPATLQTDERLPAAYRSLGLLHLGGDDSAGSLDAVYQPAVAQQGLRRSVLLALLGPIIVAALAYAALICLCLFATPSLEAVYSQLGRQPNLGVRLLSHALAWMPVWLVLAPLLLAALGLVLLKFNAVRGLRWAPVAKTYLASRSRSGFARHLSLLCKNGVPESQGVPLAAGLSAAPELQQACAAWSSREQDADRDALPPLLRWALTDSQDPQEFQQRLLVAADYYDDLGAQLQRAWRSRGPALVGALLGGIVVLAYGLLLFYSISALLQSIANATA